MKNNLMKFATVAAMTAAMALAAQQSATTPPNTQAPAGAKSAAPAHRPFARMRHRYMQALNLSAEQKQQAKAIFQETRQKTEPVRAELRQNRQAMGAAVKADNKSEIQKLSKADGEMMGRMIAARSEARAKFYNLLTPEQRATSQKLRAEFRHRMEQRRAEHRG